MRKIGESLLLALLGITMIFNTVFAKSLSIEGTNAKTYLNGDGSLENPYIITTAKELDSVRENLSAHYKLGNNIDLSEYLDEGGEGYDKWGESGWEPIGKPDDLGYECFTGSFDGAHHVIFGLWINRADTNGIGLFGSANSYDNYINIQNLGISISEDNIIGKDNVGGLIGCSDARIRNCYVTGGNVIGANGVGGLIGSQSAFAELANSYATVDVEGSGNYIGGLIGFGSGSVGYSCSAGNVNGVNYCGGLIGNLESMASITYSYSNGDVTGSGNSIGGLVGFCYDGSVSNSYSISMVQGNSYVGGLIGQQAGLSVIGSSHFTGNVTATENYAGGLVGAQISPPYFENYNIIDNCYARGGIETKGEHFGAVSGYTDEESSISNCYRYDGFNINGNKISQTDENSFSDKCNGAVVIESNLTFPPIVSTNLSEVEMTDKPVTVTLDVADSEKIKSVSYVKMSQPSSVTITNGDIATAYSDVDVYSLITDIEKYSGLIGGYKSATLIYDYYINAGYLPEDTENVKHVENNTFETTQNGEYIICVEDKSDNKTFVYINIDNITDKSEYYYDIKALSVSTVAGTEIESPLLNESFIVDVEIEKVQDRSEKDYIFVAIFGTDGKLLNLDYVKANFAVSSECSFGFNIPPLKEVVGSTKAYVWNDFNSMEPLAESKTLKLVTDLL